ncbi:MAG: hypothetical protein U1F39_06850 [Steroidobacteraceae bacterium]
MSLVYLMIQLVSGIVGGNAGGAMLRPGITRTVSNSLLGAMGGVCCAQLLGRGPLSSEVLDLVSMSMHVAGGVLGGSVLVIITGLLRAAVNARE